ncbi:MAG: hypothetical protein M3R60_11065 [Pseudomonadota bacterium]|nr:hypothetical protein [Pseudomonadota bacterium]
MEAFIVTVVPALFWDWLAWKVYRRLTPRIRGVSIFPISATAFFGFFATTLYISHGRVMTVPEAACVALGLLLLNAVIVARKRT